MPTDGFSYGGSTAISRVVNNFVHDLCTGMWFACLLVLWVVERQSVGVPAEAAAVLSSASVAVFWLLVLSLAGIAITGAIRLMYWRAETPADMLRAKRPALIAKHVAFVVVFGLGTLWAAQLAFG
jgi:putative copper export protein